MIKKVFSLLLLVSVLIGTGCSKADDSKTKTELISQTSWKFDKAMAGVIDVSAQVPSCYKDNVITFQSNGNGTVSEGADICSPPAPATFTWSFQSSETILNLSFSLFAGGSGNFDIVTLNETTLAISQVMTIPPLPATTVTVSFKH